MNRKVKKKPYRFCIFCKKYSSYLRRHIKTKHKKEPEVIKALSLPKKEQQIVFQKFKRQGIFEVNQAEAKKVNPLYERERSAKIENGISYCSHCLMFASRRYWHSHVKNCQQNSCQTIITVPVRVLQVPDDIKISDAFRTKTLAKFKTDNIGQICCTDPMILRIGSMLFNKEKHKFGKAIAVRNSLHTDMRRLANLYVIFLQEKQVIIKVFMICSLVSILMH